MEINKTIFLEFMGNLNNVKVIDFFLDNYDSYYSLKELNKFIKIDYKKLKESVSILKDKKILKKLKNKKLKEFVYKMNIKNNISLKLFQLNWELIKQEEKIYE